MRFTFQHEQSYRSEAAMVRLRDARVTVCGAGAIGANLAENLARTGVGSIRIVDCDRIDERNLSTQPYQRDDVGGLKARILANALYRAVGVAVDPRPERLTERNAAKLVDGCDLVVDAFDNSASRRLVGEQSTASGIRCLHAGIADGFAEVLWNECYRVPSATDEDLCDYPLARTLAMLTAAVTAEVAVRFLAFGVAESYTVTLKDLAIRGFD